MLQCLALLTPVIAAPKRSAKKRPIRISTQRRIDILLNTDAAKTARWGIHVVDLKSEKVIYQKNESEHFTPASNTKLFTTALALERLGPDHRFITTIRADRAVNADGVLQSDLRIVGGADPTLSGRSYPYRKDDDATNPLEPIEQLAEQLISKGVREIQGNIVGDDRLFVHAPYPEGWTIDDSIWEFGAPVSALPFNDNAFTVTLRPADETGDPATININPPSIPLIVDNRVTTIESGRGAFHVDRAPGSRQILIEGTMGKERTSSRQLLAVDDPALYAAHVLRDVLTRRGIKVHGAPVALHRFSKDEPFDPDYGVEFARRISQPLSEVARVVNKVSQNLHAEILLREVARVKSNEATREAGLKELSAFLKEIGIEADEYHFEDGSGLSRRTLVSPQALTTLLGHMDKSANAALWDSLLPIAAEDGSLANRFEKDTKASVIHAKTGTLATASALSGYITTKRDARLAFSVIANNYTAPAAEIRKVADRIGLALIEWEGK